MSPDLTQVARGATDEPLLEDLTAAQREAVVHEAGPLLIIAGAGTGKTTVITRRIAWLLMSQRLPPDELLALTFTEKAAAEMEERVDLLVPYGYVDVVIDTFHAFGDRLLREHALRVGLTPQFRVLSQAEQLVFLRQHVFDLPLGEFRPLADPTRFLDALATVFARAKDEAVGPEEFLAYAAQLERQAGHTPADDALRTQVRRARELALAYETYQRLLQENDAADFGDQILLAIQLLERHPDVLAAVQSRVRHLLVDEFQDTNFAQFRLLQLLARPEANITVVADDDQCLPAGTQIATPEGPQPIEQIRAGQEVLTGVGKGHVGTARVTKTFRSVKPVRLLTLKTKSGKVVRVTDNHKMFCYIPSHATRKDLHYVYLMHRRDRGWRIGVTNDLAMRLRLERSADRIVGLRAFRSDADARFHETLWSLTYGIPTTVFKPRTGIVIQGDLMKQLHLALNTDERVQRLAADLHVELSAHHACLNGVHRGGQRRVKINLSMCHRRYRSKADRGRVLKKPSVLHQVSIQTSNPEAVAAIRNAGLPLRQASKGWVLRLTYADLPEAGAMAERLATLTQGILEATCAIGRFNYEHCPALLMPAKNVLVGHFVPILDPLTMQIMYDQVVDMTEEHDTLEVFDLEVERTHNFIADGVVVHNSIYQWRGAAISNVLKFLDHYASVRTVVLTENFRSGQMILDCAYRLIRFNDPDRLEVKQGIDKRLVARGARIGQEPRFHVFDTVSSEADWVVSTIRGAVESGLRRPGDFAILVRSNREADLFLRALNVAGVPWQFSGGSRLFAREESKLLISCLKALSDPDDSLSWYHVASSALYRCPMSDLAAVLALATRTNQSFRAVASRLDQDPAVSGIVSEAGKGQLSELLADVGRLLEESRRHSAGQLLYRWLSDRGWLAALSRAERQEEVAQLATVARFFTQLRRAEELTGGGLPELMQHLELFQAMGNEPAEEDDAWADRVNVLTLHKAKGLEFPVVFLVGLVHGRFPTPQRRDPIELPEQLIKDFLPAGDYHLQEERRLFYVGMTRAKEELHLTCAYDYGGKTTRKVSRFVLEALDLPSPSPTAKRSSARELIERAQPRSPLPLHPAPARRNTLRLDPHGLDDYQTCPLKYRYSHVLRIPVFRHHLVVYGAALHKAVEAFFTRVLAGSPMDESELLEIFERHWHSEGFLSREHEELRLAQGHQTLRRFFARQQDHPERPTLIEEKFKFLLDDLLIVGRWDRVDRTNDEAVIIDYKSSEVRDQDTADRRTRDSLQMLVYALAWRTLHGRPPDRVELRFLETDVTGRAQFTEDDFERARTLLRQAAQGIRAHAFPAQPQEFACRWCAFQSICPFAFQTR